MTRADDKIEARRTGDHRAYSRMAFAAIAVVFGGFGAWASLAPLDSAAVAHARVSVDGERKPIQHLEGGIVREVLVKDGQRVALGDVLFRLQPIQAQANADLLTKQIDQALAIEARLLTESQGHASLQWPKALLERRHVLETATAMGDQERQFAERRRSTEMQVSILRTRLDQTGRDISGREKRLAALEMQSRSLTQEVAGVQTLADRGYYPRNKLAALQRELARIDGELGGTQSEVAKLQESLAETRLQIRQIEMKTTEDAALQIPEVRARLSDAHEKLAVAKDVLTRIEVRSPAAGIVIGVKVNGAGAVVAAGSILAEVVPQSERLALSARVSPLDVQAVAIGQKATVRFPGLSSRSTPVIVGRVDLVSADSLVDEATKETYYLTRVVIDRAGLDVDVAKLISPGMPADVMISTGERTALDYLVGPLRDTLAKAMRER
jgi:HlyD family secretion protein